MNNKFMVQEFLAFVVSNRLIKLCRLMRDVYELSAMITVKTRAGVVMEEPYNFVKLEGTQWVRITRLVRINNAPGYPPYVLETDQKVLLNPIRW